MGTGKSVVSFDQRHTNGTYRHSFELSGTIKKCIVLPGPYDYQYKQCAVVVNEVLWEKLRFFIYDERYDHVFEVFQTTSHVQLCYDKLCNLLTDQQPANLSKSLRDLHQPDAALTRSYRLEDVQQKLGRIMERKLVQRGDLIARPMAGAPAGWHFGVYIDRQRVYHWISKDAEKSKGQFGVTTFGEFMQHATILYVEYNLVRRGRHQDVLSEANRKCQARETYDFVSNNCEHMARNIVAGQNHCRQFGDPGYPGRRNMKCIECNGWKYVHGEISSRKWGDFCEYEACDECKQSREEFLNYATRPPESRSIASNYEYVEPNSYALPVPSNELPVPSYASNIEFKY